MNFIYLYIVTEKHSFSCFLETWATQTKQAFRFSPKSLTFNCPNSGATIFRLLTKIFLFFSDEEEKNESEEIFLGRFCSKLVTRSVSPPCLFRLSHFRELMRGFFGN